MFEYILFVAGIILLVKGADWLVDGASGLATRLGISQLIIGMTIVAFGTSLPELIVNILAALRGSSDVALGNVIGSNLVNVLLGLGIAALFVTLQVKESIVWKEIPFALLATMALVILTNRTALSGQVSTSLFRADGLLLLLFFAIFMYYMVQTLKQQNSAKSKKETGDVMSVSKIVLYLSLGFVGLHFGGTWTVDGAIFIARQFGLSEFLISATILAIGTSLPDALTAIIAARKNNFDMALGAIVGSNIFNILLILGITTVIAPITIPSFIGLDLLFLSITSTLLFLFMFVGRKHKLERWQGLVFVSIYVVYMYMIIVRG